MQSSQINVWRRMVSTVIDETYEFSAPQFFDFLHEESGESRRRRWFQTGHSGARSPCMPKMKTGRSIDAKSLCTFSEVEKMQKMKPKLTLTRAKETELKTAQRVRSVKVKSSAELEEEMMAKMPKFKILNAPTIPRCAPQLPEFQEFHLETEARAMQAAESSSITSTEVHHQKNSNGKLHLTEPKSPVLQTLPRVRPPRVKSSFKLEQEELEKVPKFKARPLNKKIFESKGEMFCSAKKHVAKPREFRFATDERIPLPTTVDDLFNKPAISSEPRREYMYPRNTKPNPFHLHTEERGAEKEIRFFKQLVQKALEDERARIPKANPYPYTIDYPVILPKPEPKPRTNPEPFRLKSLVRHEEEMQKQAEEKRRREREEAEMRIFKAQPVLKEDPIPLPEKVRRPLTQVQSFNLQLDHRAVQREEFDQKMKEKEMIYKRHSEKTEEARLVEEEKALKQMRRTMVPHARPVPNFCHPFRPQKSIKETTKAKSSNLRVSQQKETRKLIRSGISVSSAAASQMR